MRNVVEKVSGLLRVCGVVASAGASLGFASLEISSSSRIENSSSYSPLVVFSHIDTEARGKRCNVRVNRANGLKGERFINRLIGGVNNPKKGFSYISPVDGRRKLRYPDIREEFIDASGNVTIMRATEVKVGYTTLTPRIREQIMRDGELVRRGIYQKADWQFVKSPETGMSGASEEVKEFLNQNGITWNEDKVTDISNF